MIEHTRNFRKKSEIRLGRQIKQKTKTIELLLASFMFLLYPLQESSNLQIKLVITDTKELSGIIDLGKDIRIIPSRNIIHLLHYYLVINPLYNFNRSCS